MTTKINKILITGAGGFVGTNLVNYLCTKFDLFGVFRETFNKNEKPLVSKLVMAYYYDGGFDSIQSIMDLVRPDLVIHLASFPTLNYKGDDIKKIVEADLLYGLHVLEAMKEYGICNFINTGSYTQNCYNSSYYPQSLYSAIKQSFVTAFRYYVNTYKINVLTLNLATPYGAHNKNQRILGLIEKSLKTGEKLKLTSGEQYIDLVNINDVCRAYEKAILLLEENESSSLELSYRVSSLRPIKLKALLSMVEEITATTLNVELGAIDYRENEFFEPWTYGDLLPNWHPEISLEEGLTKLLSLNKEETL